MNLRSILLLTALAAHPFTVFSANPQKGKGEAASQSGEGISVKAQLMRAIQSNDYDTVIKLVPSAINAGSPNYSIFIESSEKMMRESSAPNDWKEILYQARNERIHAYLKNQQRINSAITAIESANLENLKNIMKPQTTKDFLPSLQISPVDKSSQGRTLLSIAQFHANKAPDNANKKAIVAFLQEELIRQAEALNDAKWKNFVGK